MMNHRGPSKETEKKRKKEKNEHQGRGISNGEEY